MSLMLSLPIRCKEEDEDGEEEEQGCDRTSICLYLDSNLEPSEKSNMVL